MTDKCLFCGEPVPEGRMVCPSCERKAMTGKMSRSDLRRIQRQQEKNNARYYLTRAEIEAMVRDGMARERKAMIEEYNAEFIARDAEIKNQLINLVHRLWLTGLGKFGIEDRELTYNLDQYVKQQFRKFSEHIEMHNSDAAREMLDGIGVEPGIIGLAEKHWRADPDEEITIDIEEE